MNFGVIGIGVMGTNHVRILSEMEEVDSVFVSDLDKEKLDKIRKQYHVERTYVNYKEMLEKEDLTGVIIAVPSNLHKVVVLDCIEKGVSILVEKPISNNLESAEEMIKKSEKSKGLLTVGHTERFNPIVSKIKELLNDNFLGKIYLINTLRIGPFPKRLYGTTDGALIDLSVHDTDIIRYLVGDITLVQAKLIFSGSQEIYAKALFRVDKGVTGSSEFSWVSPKKTRKIEIYGEKGVLEGDYINQELHFYENSDIPEDALTKGNISEGKVIKYFISKQEPLKLELKHFIDCIKNNKKSIVSLGDAKRALEIAIEIYEAGRSNMPAQV